MKKIDLNKSISKNLLDEKLYLNYFDIIGKDLYLKKDSTIIKYNLIIPRNYTVKIIDNQSIKLVNNAFIFSYSNWGS